MKLAYRLSLNEVDIHSDANFEKTLEAVACYRGVIDEVCIFTESWHHGYVSMEHIKALAPVFTRRMQQLRAAGIPSVGLNILETIGQLEEAWDWLEEVPFQTMVGHDGGATYGQMCYRTEAYKAYIQEKYRCYAEAAPDFIWVDDDIRPSGHGVSYPCFCHYCVRRFNRLVSGHYWRDTLISALNAPGNTALREAWTRYNRDGLNDLMALLRETVHQVNPQIRLGLMTIHVHGDTYGQADHAGLMKSLGAKMIRPGEGFYDDREPIAFYEKALSVGYQLAVVPKVDDRQYELEDFPNPGKKSVSMHLLELTCALMMGCNGIALNMVPHDRNKSIFDALAKHRRMWEEMTSLVEKTSLRGGTPAFDALFDARRIPRSGNWFTGRARELWNQEISPFLSGLPYTPKEEESTFFVLSGEMAETIDDERIKGMLTRGVLMDGEALVFLCERGYGHLCGCEIERAFASGMRETFLEHPLNGEESTRLRDVYQTFYRWTDGRRAHALRLLPGAVPLSTLSSVTHVPSGIASCAFENDLGGRVIVCGYVPWRFSEVPERAAQLRRYVDWLSKNELPVGVEGVSRILPVYRESKDKSEFLLMLINASLDDAVEFRLRLRSHATGLLFYWDEYGKKKEITKERISQEGDVVTIRIDRLAGWKHMVIASSPAIEGLS